MFLWDRLDGNPHLNSLQLKRKVLETFYKNISKFTIIRLFTTKGFWYMEPKIPPFNNENTGVWKKMTHVKKRHHVKKMNHENFFLKKYSVIVTLDLNNNLIYRKTLCPVPPKRPRSVKFWEGDWTKGTSVLDFYIFINFFH